MDFKVLAVGDVVGNPGMNRISYSLRYLTRKTNADFVIVNGENASVVGMTPQQAEDILDAGADLITFHIESDDDPAATIDRIHSNGVAAGLSLKPATPASAVLPYLDRIDLLLVMTVEPGFGGQRFMPDQLRKIAELRQAIDASGRAIRLEVDGGIDARTAPLVRAAGADTLVAGTAVFQAPQGLKKAIRDLRS